LEQKRDSTPEDVLVDHLQRVVGALEADDREAAAATMAEIAFSPAQTERRPSLTPRLQAEVFRRDAFTCRYCGTRTVPPPVLRVLSALFPVEFPYHPNWKSDVTHRAHWTISTTCDHVTAGTLGGDWREAENLITACWTCNQRKANLCLEQLGWTLRPVPAPGWDGLVGAYPKLWELAGRPDPAYHRRWLTAL
jgi:5-methylcytosine-specific restriction endonuclease McrA